MPTGTILLLGMFAGLTIFLGLPFARLKNASPQLRTLLSMTATGVLLFLLYDVVAHMSEPIAEALTQLHQRFTPGHVGVLLGLLAVMVAGLLLGSVGLVAFNRIVMERLKLGKGLLGASKSAPAPASLALASSRAGKLGEVTRAKPKIVAPVSKAAPAAATPASGELAPETVALIIATGIGLHNFSEGLAIGQSAVTGATQLAAVLIIGFGLHNMTEGFGIAGPLAGRTVPWKFLFLLGLIGGGPTFLGTIVGMVFHSTLISVLFLALAAGAIIYVVAELLGVARRANAPYLVMCGLVLGFMLGYMTDMIVSFAGA